MEVCSLDSTDVKYQFQLHYQRCENVPVGERKSQPGTLNAGSEPRPTCVTTEAITALRMTIEVVFVSETDEEESAGDGHRTDSTSKKQPETAALNPVK